MRLQTWTIKSLAANHRTAAGEGVTLGDGRDADALEGELICAYKEGVPIGDGRDADALEGEFSSLL